MIRNHSLRTLAVIAVLLLSAFVAKAQNNSYQAAIFGFYNVENFYDTIDDPKTDDAEFLPGGLNTWNAAKYTLKLERLSEVISKLGSDVVPGGPVILGLSEIENRGVLEDLVNTPLLKPMNYGIVHYNSPDRRGVDVALLYQKNRFIVDGSKPFRLTTEDTAFRTRDQLLVWGRLDGEQVYFLVNHWPSRRGGEARSAPKRKAAATLSKHIADSLYKMDPKVKFVLVGDLNDDPVDASVSKVLMAKGSVKDVVAGDLYNPMVKLYQNGIGSYAYRDSWDLYDQIIVNSNLALAGDSTAYFLMTAKIFNAQFLKQKSGTFAGYPWRTQAGGQYIAGYSDHFPVYGVLVRKKK
jgi:hypothetical protein